MCVIQSIPICARSHTCPPPGLQWYPPLRGHLKGYFEMTTLLSNMTRDGQAGSQLCPLSSIAHVCQDREHSLLGFLQIGWMVSVTQNPKREQKGKASVDRQTIYIFQPHRARAHPQGFEASVGVPSTARAKVTGADTGQEPRMLSQAVPPRARRKQITWGWSPAKNTLPDAAHEPS